MNRKFRAILTILAMVMGVLTFGLASTASATEITAEAHATSIDSVDAKAKVTASSIVNANASGKTVGAWFKNPGTKGHWKPAAALKVAFAKNYDQGAASCQPFRLKHGKWYPRTLKMRDGTPFQVEGGRHVQHAWALFDFAKGSCSTPRHRGWYNPKTHKWVGDCVNPKPGPDWPTVPANMVVEVKQHNSVTVDLELDWSAWAMVHGTVRADCGSGNWSEASFSAKGMTNGHVKLRVTARTLAEAEAEGIKQVELSIKSDIKVSGSIKVSAEVAVEGSAIASCSSNPPPTYEAPGVDVTPMACVAPGDTQDASITVSNPNSVDDTAKVTYRGQVYTKSVAAHGQVTFTFPNQGAGSYSGTALLVTADKSKSFTITVAECVYPAPLFMQFRQFNDLYKSLPEQPTTMDHCVTVDFPSGHSGSVFWEANRGSFATTTKPAQDGVQVCSTYTAPSESGTDTITVTATDSVSGKSVQKTSDPFTIKEWPAIP
jgi:hypothetical protein